MAEPVFEPLPPTEAVRFFRAKGVHVGYSWLDTAAEEHLRSFTVAKAMRLDILEDIAAALDEALAEGTTFETFYKRLEPTLRRKGWWGRQPVTDPEDGITRMVQLGSPRRLRIIFDTNIRMAYARGQWERIERVAEARPYLRYVTVQDSRVRPKHAAWHGIVLRWDHPFWKTHFPPNGWNCRCTVQQLSADDLDDFGYTLSAHPPQGWNDTRDWVNRRTGKTLKVPRGIDPGFGHNVGLINANQAAANRLIDRIDTAPPDLARAAIGQPWTGRPFQHFLKQAQKQNAADRLARHAPGDWPVAVVEDDLRSAISGNSRTLRLSSGTAQKQRDRHGELGPDTYGLVQRILDEGELFHASRARHAIAYLEINGQLWCAVIKSTADRHETFLQSLHRARPRNLTAARLDLEGIDRKKD